MMSGTEDEERLAEMMETMSTDDLEKDGWRFPDDIAATSSKHCLLGKGSLYKVLPANLLHFSVSIFSCHLL